MKKFTALVAGLALTTGWAMADTIQIEPELPQPVYGGTPLDYWGENLETPSYRPIPPIVAPAGSSNVALNKSVTTSAGAPSMGSLDMITNGMKDAGDEHVVEIEPGHQWVQIDLGEETDIYAIVMWHFHSSERVYFDVAVQVGADADMTQGVETVFNNDHDNSAGMGVGSDQEYVESYRGRIIRINETLPVDANLVGRTLAADVISEESRAVVGTTSAELTEELIAAISEAGVDEVKVLRENGVRGRFVRLYSAGNTSDDANHYIEVEVYGKSASAR